ncbi:MAG: Rrf2 family transcriptional regulator [Pseudomonadota bacterium]
MRLTTRRRYAVTAMLDVAMHQQNGPVSLTDISRRQGISQSYLEQLFSKLRRRRLVKSVRGPGGGYVINGDLEDIAVTHIIDAIDEKSLLKGTMDCNTGKMITCDCAGQTSCLTQRLWSDLSDVMHQFLNKITLAQLMEQHREYP